MKTNTLPPKNKEYGKPADRALPPTGLGFRLVGEEEEALVLDVIRRKELNRYYQWDPSNPAPPMVATLEKEFAEMMGVDYALGLTSGTAALETALGALGIGPGDDVLVPAFSWMSDFMAIVRVGARPVMVEIDKTFCFDPEEISRRITPKTKALIVVHYQGSCANIDKLLAEAHKHGIKVIEDVSQSIGATFQGKRLGSFGDVTAVSFQNNKCLTTGEGGILTTNDPEIYERAVRFHDLGGMRPQHAAIKKPTQSHIVGAQYRMNELVGAVGLAQLRKLEGLLAHMRKLSKIVLDKLERETDAEFRDLPDREGQIGFETYLFLDSPERAARFMEATRTCNLNCSRTTMIFTHYNKAYCNEGLTHYGQAACFDGMSFPNEAYSKDGFPVTEDLIHRCVSMPMGVLFTEEDARHMADVLVYAYHQAYGVTDA